MRAPYLHNGSVPTLVDLLHETHPLAIQPDAAVSKRVGNDYRPTTFYRGYDVYDPMRVGFLSRQEEILKQEVELSGEQQTDKLRQSFDNRHFLYDTTIPGNSNCGHEGEAYGTKLDNPNKSALVEFLKTL